MIKAGYGAIVSSVTLLIPKLGFFDSGRSARGGGGTRYGPGRTGLGCLIRFLPTSTISWGDGLNH